MSAINTMKKMLTSAGVRYKEVGTMLRVPSQHAAFLTSDHNVDIVFTSGGDHFLTGLISFEDDQAAQNSLPQSEAGDDYSEIVNMVKNAPLKKGQYQEAKSRDGKYIGLLYQDNDCEYGVAWICNAADRKFLGVVGF